MSTANVFIMTLPTWNNGTRGIGPRQCWLTTVERSSEMLPTSITSDRPKEIGSPKQIKSNSIGRGGLVVRSRPPDRRVAGSKLYSTEDPPRMGPAASPVIPPAGAVRKLGEGVPFQVSSSSSDRSSKLRSPTLNIPRVAAKRAANLTQCVFKSSCSQTDMHSFKNMFFGLREV
ncbi:hypothetical protein AVEN_120461-1 [Araneus ventricosus]|uniref:Uncharacterized protein n=1 Tax=Araneus ventricosus TaxID=182803 RepID=A0A4Y2P2X8_ARAVE|nr:hypothetical protein AVEN_120461-1 [Araneus ventricosus]